MTLRSLGRLSIFLACTYVIANSLLLAICAIFYEAIPEDYYHWYYKLFGERPKGFFDDDFIDVLTQSGVYNPFRKFKLDPMQGMFIMANTLYNIAVLAYPIVLWWRNRTVFNAWLVAMAGVLMPPYLDFLFFGHSNYIAYGLLLMTTWYALAWFIVPPDKRF